jgi:hypothetical protein
MRKWWVTAAFFALIAAMPVMVIAATRGGNGPLDHQKFKFRTGKLTTASKSFRAMLTPIHVCATRQVAGTVSAQLGGGPALVKVVLDEASDRLHPGNVVFNPGKARRTSFTFEFAGMVTDGSHSLQVFWRSPTGRKIRLTKALLNVQYSRGSC